jgi:uncharacterized membrane protein
MDTIIKFIIGLLAIWFIVSFSSIFITLLLLYGIYALGNWIYNSTRD